MSRSYKISNTKPNTWALARVFCQDIGLGLAMWDTAESYDDMMDISASNAVSDGMWTALTNTNSESCDGANACDGKLVRNKILWYHDTLSRDHEIFPGVVTNL